MLILSLFIMAPRNGYGSFQYIRLKLLYIYSIKSWLSKVLEKNLQIQKIEAEK